MITTCNGIFLQRIELPVLYFLVLLLQGNNICRTGALIYGTYLLSVIWKLKRFSMACNITESLFCLLKYLISQRFFSLLYAYFIAQRWKDLLHDSVCLTATQNLLSTSSCAFVFWKLIVLARVVWIVSTLFFFFNWILVGLWGKKTVDKCILFSNDNIFWDI